MRILLFPFHILWSLIGFILGLTGRLVAAVLGLAIIICGLILTFTVVGAFVGVPLCILGVLLLLRAVF